MSEKQSKTYSAVINVTYVASVEAENISEARRRLWEETVGSKNVDADNSILPAQVEHDGITMSQASSACGNPQQCGHKDSVRAVAQCAGSVQALDALEPANRKRLLARAARLETVPPPRRGSTR